MKSKYIVFFDLDSTLCKIEGLDYLAKLKGKKEKVSELTKQAMEGKIPFKEAIVKKLSIVRPSKKDLRVLSQTYIKNISPSAKELIKKLFKAKAEVFIITGSFKTAVYPLAEFLGIKKKNVFANEIIFDEKGDYKGLNLNNPLTENGGKPKIVGQILSKQKKPFYSIFIGDSITDLETQKIVDLFIGYTGVIEREIIKRKAKVSVKDLAEVAKILNL